MKFSITLRIILKNSIKLILHTTVFKEFDKVDIAYNRVSAKGDVLGVDLSDFRGKPSCRVMIALDGEIISDTIEVDFEEYKEDIIELHHYPKDETKESVYIEVI